MKRVKKVVLLLLALVMAVTVAASCTDTNNGGEANQNGTGTSSPSVSQKWETSTTEHWHEETEDGVTRYSDRGLHSFSDDDVCDVCQYKAVPSEGLEYELTSDGTGYILKGLGSCQDHDLVVPMQYDGKPVVKVADGAFKKSTYINNLVILNGVNELGFEAFNGISTLKHVILPSSLRVIGEYALSGYVNLGTSYGLQSHSIVPTITDISFSNGLETIGNNALSCLLVTSIKLPDSVKKIGGFNNCDNLRYFNTGEGLEETTSRILFYGREEVELEIVIGASVRKFGGSLCDNSEATVTITFNGTREQWNNIEWELEDGSDVRRYPQGIYITCSDGIIE